MQLRQSVSSTPPALVKATADGIKGARFVEIEGAGHFFQEEEQMQSMLGSVSDYVKRRLTETTR